MRGPAVGARALVVAAVLVLSLPGCALVKKPSQSAVERVENQLELGEIGDVVCTYSNYPFPWEPQNATRQLGIAGADKLEEVVDRLEDLGFEKDDLDDTLYRGPDNADVRISEYGAELAGTEPPWDFHECVVPGDGLVVVYLLGFPE